MHGPITKWHWSHKIYLDGHTQIQYVLSKYNNTTDGHTVVRVKVKLGACHTGATLQWGLTKTGDGPPGISSEALVNNTGSSSNHRWSTRPRHTVARGSAPHKLPISMSAHSAVRFQSVALRCKLVTTQLYAHVWDYPKKTSTTDEAQMMLWMLSSCDHIPEIRCRWTG